MKQIRTLPPGLDGEEEALFGTMWINIGTIKLIRTSNAVHRVLCQFWGETTPALLSTRFDTSNNQVERMQKYNIKCPITFFAEYLEEMKNNLKLEVQDVGKVNLDISKFLKKNITIDSKYAFEHFKGFFQIIGKGNRKAGSLEIQMGCQFYPQVALQEIGESGLNEIRENERKNCPADKLEIKQCCGKCQCICGLNQKKMNKVKEQKKMVIEDDPRIPHSLNTKPRQESQFDPKKYEARQQPVLITKHQGKKAEKKQIDPINEFPQVPKILTYSNLRLNYEDQQLKKQVYKQSNQSYFSQSEVIKQTGGPKAKDILNQIGNSVEDPHYQIKSKPQITRQQLLNQFYGAENSPFKSNLQPIKQKREARQEKQKDKLSRVINLDEELNQFKKLQPPPNLALDTRERDIDTHVIRENIRKKAMPKSNMVLTLFVEIQKDSVSLNTKQAFIIAYRPYGQKQRLTLGPNFMELINIFSVVGEAEIKKMNKTPLILQFWSATTNKFVGLVKIDLTRIKQGFILQDRLNQMAIKTNIHPTTVTKGTIKVTDLSDEQVGSCSMFVGIGTSNQINSYINQKPALQRKQDKAKKQGRIAQSQSVVHMVKQPEQKQKDTEKKTKIIENQQSQINEKTLILQYDVFLAALYKKNSHIIQMLNKLMNQRYINKKELSELAKSIGVGQFSAIFQFHLQLSNTLQKGKQKERVIQRQIDFHEIADSFDLYIDLIDSIRKDQIASGNVMKNLIKKPEEAISKLKQVAPMNVINMKKALEVLEKFTTYFAPIKEFMSKFNQYIKIETISEILRGKGLQAEMKEVQLSQFNSNYINLMISRQIIGKLNREQSFLEDLRNCHEVSPDNLFGFAAQLVKINPKVGLWGFLKWVLYFSKANIINFQDIQQNYQNFMMKKEENKKEENTSKLRHSESIEKQTSQVGITENNEPIIEESAKKVGDQKKSEKEAQQNQLQKNGGERNPKLIKQEEKVDEKVSPQMSQKQNFYKYLFTINPIQITLQNPIRGNCIVSYDFPFEEEQVKSKSFLTATQKSKYPLKMYGTHGFSIQDSPEHYFSDNPIKFTVRIDKRIEYEGALPSDELLVEPNTEETKIIPLFSERKQGIAGKIKINITYEKIKASEGNLGKQTTYQLFLPKTGYINYFISCQVHTSKIRSQLNIKQEFYVALVLDIFYHNSAMRSQFPPISSKLYSDSSINAELGGSIKLSLTTNVLQYIKKSTGRLSLNIIYYSKENGNFERKQIPYAVIQLPLISIIKAEGIKGDYAFKNKLGMFVSLAKCQLRYQKDNTTKLAVRDQPTKNLYSYWLILNFLQFLNFDPVKYSWVKMEFIIKGKKYSTQKIQLEPYSVNFLSKSAILVKFTEQEFVDTKVIPVTIVTNTLEKLAIDINLKAMSKDIILRKYSVLGQYFVVVNQSSRPTKMRIGLKSYCFRGGPLLSNFVNSLYQHLDTQIFDVMQYPEQVQNYEQVLQVFKNNLKLNKKALQEALNQLDISKNKEKLTFDFFTNRIYYKLDFTPILAANQSDIEFICQQLDTQIGKGELMKYLEQSGIKLQNFRPEFLDRYSFRELNKLKADKNVDFLGLSNEIDLISFVRKIKILEHSHQQMTNKGNSLLEETVLQMTVLQGTSLEQLYNGIKPNCIIRIPQYGLQTQISHRNSNPYFNETFEIQLQQDNIPVLRNLKFEAYHCTNDEEDMQNILIGEGTININISQLKINAFRVIKVILHSVMSSKAKASINVKFGLIQERHTRNREMSSQNVEQSGQASRLGEIIHGIRQELAYKDKLFQSSDEDY